MLDLAFGPSFKVKRWFTGFDELSFQWIQICIGSPMRRSIYNIVFKEIFQVVRNRQRIYLWIKIIQLSMGLQCETAE